MMERKSDTIVSVVFHSSHLSDAIMATTVNRVGGGGGGGKGGGENSYSAEFKASEAQRGERERKKKT